jgi:ADP-ribose pyrophosphatase YjhB (NUDIX family)
MCVMSEQPFNSASATRLLAFAQRLQALAQAGIAYQTNAYDLERFEEIRVLSSKLLQEITDEPFEKIVRLFASETGYQTPKVDIRAVVFGRAGEILMVREKMDQNRWTLPGGWADIACTPSEVAVKETQEETGLLVKPVRLLALFDKRKHAHPPQAGSAYKAFIQCEVEGGTLLQETPETLEAGWKKRNELASLDLSLDRVTAPQLETLFAFAEDPLRPALCD